MKRIEQFKNDKEKIKALPDKESKLLFIWDYYKVPIIAAVLVLVIGGITFFSNLGRKDISMYVACINNDTLLREVDDTVFDTILKDSGFDLGDKTVDIMDYMSLGQEGNEEEDISNLQVLNALFTISDLDVYFSDKTYFDFFVQVDGFENLYELIDNDLLNSHADRLYIYQNANGEDICGGIILKSDSPIHKAGYYHNEVYMGIVSNATNMEAAVAFVTQILK